MNFKSYLKLVEDRNIVVDQRTVRVYHGTNTDMAADIERYGLQSISGAGAFSFMKDLAARAVGAVSPDLWRALRKMASGYRTPCIFVTPNEKIAIEHARLHYRTGGEVGEEVTDLIKDVTGEDVVLFPDAGPCVVTLDIPRAWLTRDHGRHEYEIVIHREEITPDHIVSIDGV